MLSESTPSDIDECKDGINATGKLPCDELTENCRDRVGSYECICKTPHYKANSLRKCVGSFAFGSLLSLSPTLSSPSIQSRIKWISAGPFRRRRVRGADAQLRPGDDDLPQHGAGLRVRLHPRLRAALSDYVHRLAYTTSSQR